MERKNIILLPAFASSEIFSDFDIKQGDFLLTYNTGLHILPFLFVILTMRPFKKAQFYSRSRKARILTTGILVVFRGLEFESDTARPAIALATAEDWAKGGVFQRYHHIN
jgi:hypothetical protein